MLFLGVLCAPMQAAEHPVTASTKIIEYSQTEKQVVTDPVQKSNKTYTPPKIEGNAAAALILSFLSIIFLAIYPPLGMLSILVAIVCIIRSKIRIKKEPKERWRGRKFTTFSIILLALLLGILGALLGSGTLQRFF